MTSVIDGATTTGVAPAEQYDVVRMVMDYIRDPQGGSSAELFRILPTQAGVVRLPLNMYVVTTAELVRRGAAAPQLVMGSVDFTDETIALVPDFVRFFTSTLSLLPREDHHRLRRIMSEHFTPKGVARMRPAVEAVVADLVAEANAAGPDIDLVTVVSNELPMRAMGLVLGIPKDEWGAIAAGGRAMLARIAHSFPGLAAQDEPIDNDGFLALRARVEALLSQDVPDYSLTASLREAMTRGELTRGEATQLMLLLFMTGIDTVAASLTNIVLTLLTRPEALDGWLSGRTATRDVVEEALRLQAPLPFGLRLAAEDITLGDVTIPAGATVMLCNASVNVDPARFERPLDWAPAERPLSQTFGHGTYRCLGAMLAILECELTLDAFAPVGLRLGDPDGVRWRSDISFHTPTRLPVTLGQGWGERGLRPAAGGARA